MVEEQRKRKDPLPSFTGSFTKSQRLPCAHILRILQEKDQVLLLEHFHSHWHLKREGAPQLLLEPRQRIEEISKSSRIPKQSTTREPSGFEAVERAAAPRAVPKCSKCGASGHIRTSKACPQRYSELLRQPPDSHSITGRPINLPARRHMCLCIVVWFWRPDLMVQHNCYGSSRSLRLPAR